MQILAVMSQVLLKRHKMLNFIFTFFVKTSETMKAHISGTEADINKWQEAFCLDFNGLSY